MKLLHRCTAEFIGTFTLVFAGCGALMGHALFAQAYPSGSIPVIFGLAVATMIYAVGHLSGAHFNPAVTLAFTIGRHFPIRDLVFYWLAQFAGSIVAMALLTQLIPTNPVAAATLPSVSVLHTFIWELVLTFFLMFVIISVATDTRAEGTMAGLAIGATVCLGALVGGPFSGASMNPARSLAPAIFAGEWAQLWIYLSAPCAGAILAVLIYGKIRGQDQR